MSSTKQIPAAK